MDFFPILYKVVKACSMNCVILSSQKKTLSYFNKKIPVHFLYLQQKRHNCRSIIQRFIESFSLLRARSAILFYVRSVSIFGTCNNVERATLGSRCIVLVLKSGFTKFVFIYTLDVIVHFSNALFCFSIELSALILMNHVGLLCIIIRIYLPNRSRYES